MLAGLSFGVVDVLTPLRLHALGAGGVLLGGAFLGAAAIEAVLAPIIGRIADRRGRALPIRASLAASVLVALILPLASPAPLLVVAVVAGLPAFGALYVPAAALISDGSKQQSLHQGLGFGLLNLAWAAGQAIAAGGSGALAQATSDVAPYVLLAVAFVLVLSMLLLRGSLRGKERAAMLGSNAESPSRLTHGDYSPP